jgi:hypothetical protein
MIPAADDTSCPAHATVVALVRSWGIDEKGAAMMAVREPTGDQILATDRPLILQDLAEQIVSARVAGRPQAEIDGLTAGYHRLRKAL